MIFLLISLHSKGIGFLQRGVIVDFTVFKKVLDNGLTVLVLPQRTIPKVSIQVWYKVGSKDEKSGQRGIAHLIEHMIFKGTDSLSESDINTISFRLSGITNAFTSHDYTGYLFDVPSQHWDQVLPVMADCMVNCTFKQQFLNSELKAVIQELKLYNDDYVSTLLERMAAAIFADHPYHYPVIGYKQDLWGVQRESLVSFYEYFYRPDNATLVIVGDIDPEDAFKAAARDFGHLVSEGPCERKRWYHSFDIAQQQVTLYREIKQPFMLMAWVIPGVSAKKEYFFDLISWVLGAGRGARLYVRLVTQLGLATEVQSFVYDLFEQGLFLVYVQPRSLDDIELIKKIILEEVNFYRTHEIADLELVRAQRKTAMDIISLSENNQRLAYVLGKFFAATNDENYLLNYTKHSDASIKKEIKDLFNEYFAPALVHCGYVLPLKEEDTALWKRQQEVSDAEDARILAGITREDCCEEPSGIKNIHRASPKPFTYPRAEQFTLANGLKVFLCNKPELGKVDLILDLKAKHFYDRPHQQGLNLMMTDVLLEGTQKRTAQQLAQDLESYGMELNTFPGQMGMTMLSRDIELGLDLFIEVLTQPLFDAEAIERTREQLLAELKMFWDTPLDFAGQLAREAVYKGHPYGQNLLGNIEAITHFSQADLINAHQRYITPYGARLALVGDLSQYPIKDLLQRKFGAWEGSKVDDIKFPTIEVVEPRVINYPINRDQVVLAFAGLSVERMHKDFDALLLFDQVLTGGVLGSMNSRLFELREKTGLFYTISGSLLAGASLQPGMFFVKAVVSNDRLLEAEREIERVLQQGAEQLSEQELDEARMALINSLVDNFAAQRNTASTFIAMDIYGLPPSYFDDRPEQLMRITASDIQKAVKDVLDTKRLVKIKIGRV